MNGRLVTEEQGTISIFDRGFVYGDGVFETIPIHNGRPFRWDSHLERFENGARFLKISPPFASAELRQSVQELIRNNGVEHGVVRIVLSRGTGPRGYSPKGAGPPTCVISSHELSLADKAHCGVITSSHRINEGDALTGHKTCNKLLHVLARTEADEAGADEALLLNSRGEAVTATAANLFWISRSVVCSPPVQAGALPGVTRAVVRELCEKCGLRYEERMISAGDFGSTNGVFLTLSSKGIVPVTSIDGTKIALAEEIKFLKQAYAELITKECRSV